MKFSNLIVRLTAAVIATALSVSALAANPKAVLKTDLGEIVFELYPEKAPATVANFLEYAESGFYNGTIFHRVIPGFVAQAGGLTFDYIKKETRDPVVNESNNGLRNRKGTVAMARLPDPDSATSQFFINLNRNTHLDAKKDQPGYTVFAKVTKGMNVVKKIVKEPQGMMRDYPQAPNTPVRILSVTIETTN
ncbi:peptidylprolyl isomerase [Maricurvus nonylphenolicus]|uniref:peptidylprolyl isomerase n=1 Tax=Maricurvus nonylphenolicus TaxID=1008307 RepID=UPI0036F3BAC0